MTNDITVVLTRIPTRTNVYPQAIESVKNQTLQAAKIIETMDTEWKGAASNRDNGLFQVTTKWTAFLDDDDFFYPNHLEELLKHALETEADLVYPWFDVFGGTDPFPQWEGQPWDNNKFHQVPITFLVSTEAAQKVGGFNEGWYDDNPLDSEGHRCGEDYHFVKKLVKNNYKIVHLNKRTWGWRHWTGNLSGLPPRRP